MKKQTCPNCRGFGQIPVFNKKCPTLPCDMCHGIGEVEDTTLLWIKRGNILKKYRMEHLEISLREAARRFNVDAANLSKMERGIISPVAVYGPIK